MQSYPLIFKFSRPVKTDNYHVAVSAKGRILMKQEFDKWWVYGVAPGGLAECGDNPNEAYYNFMNSFWSVINDIACEQTDYFSFMGAVNEFVKATNSEEEKEWKEARNAIRAGQLKEGDPFANLEKITRESYPNVEYKRLDEVKMGIDTTTYNKDELLLANEDKAA